VCVCVCVCVCLFKQDYYCCICAIATATLCVGQLHSYWTNLCLFTFQEPMRFLCAHACAHLDRALSCLDRRHFRHVLYPCISDFNWWLKSDMQGLFSAAISQLLRATQNRCMIRFSQGDDMIIYGVGLRAVAVCL
jgi:hypothetical protein